MWQRFTERARRIVFFAQEEAARLGFNEVRADHLMLGLVRENDSVAARILDRIGVPLGQVRAEIATRTTRGPGSRGQDMQLTPQAKRVIDLAYDEARELNNNYIGTEHILLGVIREGTSLGARVLSGLGADLERTRREVHAMQEGENAPAAGGPRPTGGLVGALRDVAREVLQGVRHFLSIRDLSADQSEALLALARMLKAERATGHASQRTLLRGKTLAMVLEKPSLRTRVTFEAGMTQLGGHAIYLGPADVQLGVRESVADAARNLERWVDGIVARTFRHDTVLELAQHSRVPVINGLSDREHPCQALADFLTLQEKCGNVNGLRLAFMGDGNNVAHSLMLLGARLGVHVVVACPEGYDPDAEVAAAAQSDATESGGSLTVVHDPRSAVTEADVIYADTWTSRGQEAEAEERAERFRPFQVNAELLAAARPDALVMHCLPAHRGQEITDDVIDGPQSIIFDQAENRLHVAKALLAVLL